MNTRIPLAAALFAIAPASLQAATYSDYVLSLNPTTYYRLDQAVTTPSTVVPNLGTLGAAGNGYYFSYLGSTTATTGAGGGAIAGNSGVTTTGFAVNLTDSGYAAHPLLFAQGNASFSLSMWAKPTSFGVGDWDVFFSHGEAGTNHSIIIGENGITGNGSVTIGLYNNNILTSMGTLTAGAWNHIGLTWNGSTMQLYLNGTPDNTWNGTLDSWTTYGFLGGLYTGTPGYSGGLDEYAYFNGTALTGTQMSNLSNAAIPETNTFALLGLSGALTALSFRRRMPRSATRN